MAINQDLRYHSIQTLSLQTAQLVPVAVEEVIIKKTNIFIHLSNRVHFLSSLSHFISSVEGLYAISGSSFVSNSNLFQLNNANTGPFSSFDNFFFFFILDDDVVPSHLNSLNRWWGIHRWIFWFYRIKF